jgi:phosphatidylglycerophosphate synthase
MLDRHALHIFKPLLESTARLLRKRGIKADQVTVAAFIAGIGGAAAVSLQWYLLGLCLILLNRIGDGIDGILVTDRGAFLDICLDFIFYAVVVLGFGMADPTGNGLAAAVLIFSFVGTGSSFLAYAIMAERRSIMNRRLPHKGFYYLGGLAEGTETIIFFALFCLFPTYFAPLAWIFAVVCLFAAGARIIYGYNSLK